MQLTKARPAVRRGDPPLIIGVLNVTPDSFSDGGMFASLDTAVEHGLALIIQGADLLDVGGESSRPGAWPVDEHQELARVVPVISAIRSLSDAPISIDTAKPAVAQAAVAAGAYMWNDITALAGAPHSADVAAELGCDVVLMHMQGEPNGMQVNPRYDDPVSEVIEFLSSRAAAAITAGVARSRIWLDPGIGFGKRLEHNLALLQGLDRLVEIGFPVLLGVSRKRTVLHLDPTAVDPRDRLGGSLAMALYGATKGVAALRVHDARETVQALAVWRALQQG